MSRPSLMRSAVRLLVSLVLVVPLTAAAADVDRYLPNETRTIVHVNVRSFADTDFFKKFLLAEFKDNLKKNEKELVTKLMTNGGVEPLRDIRSVTLSLSAVAKTSDANQFVTAIIHGTANVQVLSLALDALVLKNPNNWLARKQDGLTFYEVGKRDNEKESSTIFLGFLDRETLFVTTKKDHMIEAIAKATNKKKTTIDKSLQTLVTGTNAKQHVWLASLSPWFLTLYVEFNPRLMEYAGQIQNFAMGLNVQSGVVLEGRIQLAEAAKAESFRGLWEALVGDLATQLEKDPFAELKFPGNIDFFFFWLEEFRKTSPHAVKEMLKLIKVTSEKGAVMIDGKLPPAKLYEALKVKKP